MVWKEMYKYITRYGPQESNDRTRSPALDTRNVALGHGVRTGQSQHLTWFSTAQMLWAYHAILYPPACVFPARFQGPSRRELRGVSCRSSNLASFRPRFSPQLRAGIKMLCINGFVETCLESVVGARRLPEGPPVLPPLLLPLLQLHDRQLLSKQ